MQTSREIMADSVLTTLLCNTTPHSATLLCVEEQEQPENAHHHGKNVLHQPEVKSSRIHGCFRDGDPKGSLYMTRGYLTLGWDG